MKSVKPTRPEGAQERILSALYDHAAGRLLLKVLTAPWVSKAGGWLLSTRASRVIVGPFARNSGIDLREYLGAPYGSFNDFFSRRIRPELRPIPEDPDLFISPCDSRLTALPIGSDSRFTLKGTEYTLSSLLRNEELAEKFSGGWCLIFRLCVDDYHRYCYVADGDKEENIFIPGVLHTVNPIACDHYPIYKENAREYTVLHTADWGDILMMEVGALMVGKIVNHHGAARVARGQEKGYFQFGGSTVVLLVEKDRLALDPPYPENSRQGIETRVRYGQPIGKKPPQRC
ncbi:MAG: phosphatidylserine decarboxylase [Faecousia sp.]